MVADTDNGVDAPDPMEDADAWADLSREEQSDILDAGLADLRGETGSGAWRHLDESDQEATVDAIERTATEPVQGELSETERAMQEALEQTWTAEVFRDLEDVPTVPFECRELTTQEQDMLMEVGQAVMSLEGQAAGDDDASLEDLELESASFDSVEELDEWLSAFLADVTTDPAFDAERFRTGRGLRSNTRKLLFVEIFVRSQEESDRAMKFRQESLR